MASMTDTTTHQSSSKPIRLTSFSNKQQKITIDDIPDELLMLISKQIKDELTEKVREELDRIREESKREIEKIRHELLSENEIEIQRRVREEFDKWVSFFCQNNPMANVATVEAPDRYQLPDISLLDLPPLNVPYSITNNDNNNNNNNNFNGNSSTSGSDKENESPLLTSSAPKSTLTNKRSSSVVSQQDSTKKTTTSTVPLAPKVSKKTTHVTSSTKSSSAPPMSTEQIEKEYHSKKKQIDQWIQAEKKFDLDYRESKLIIEEFFTRVVNDPSVVGQMHIVANRMFNGLSWIFSNWETLEVSFKHRSDFVANSVVRHMLVNGQPTLTEYNIPLIESELGRECRFVSNLLSVKDLVEQITRREELKARISDISSTLSQQGSLVATESKKLISEKNKKSTELVQLTEKLEQQIDVAEKNGDPILYRGLRYKELLGFDRLKKEFDGMKDNENEMKKWASRYAKKFS